LNATGFAHHIVAVDNMLAGAAIHLTAAMDLIGAAIGTIRAVHVPSRGSLWRGVLRFGPRA
jgi:hypothetical protein